MNATLCFSVGIFGVMGVFFGSISYSVLLKKKPVVIPSRWILVLISLSMLPAIVLNILSYQPDSNVGWIQLITPIAFLFLIAFYSAILKGFAIYGISDTDFRRFLLEALATLNVRATERLNKLVLDDVGTELSVSFQEWMGTGMVRSKNNKKFDVARLRVEFSRLLRVHEVETKRTTAYFYIGFSVLMLGFSFGMAWLGSLV